MLRPVLDPVLGREILARYTSFAGSAGTPAPMEHLAPAGTAQPARYETYVENLYQVTQAIRKNYLINLQLDLRFLALQLASAVEQAEKTESRRLQMLERQVAVLREESGRLKAASRVPAASPKREKEARTGESLPSAGRSIVRDARLAARTPLPFPVAQQPEQESAPAAAAGRQAPLPAAGAQMVLPDTGKMTAPENRRPAAPPAEQGRTLLRSGGTEPPRTTEPMTAPSRREKPAGESPREENRKTPVRALSKGDEANPARPDVPPANRTSSPARMPTRPDPARPAPALVPLGHTDPDEQDDWAAPLPDPRPARLQRPEPARRILRTDGAERASTRQGAPSAAPVPPAVSGKGMTQSHPERGTSGTRGPDTVGDTVLNPEPKKDAGEKKTQTSARPALQSSMTPPPAQQSSAQQSQTAQPLSQFPALQLQLPQSAVPERREEIPLRTPPLVHADYSRSPAAETKYKASGEAKEEGNRQESRLPDAQKTVRPAAPAPEAVPMVYAASSPGTAGHPDREAHPPAEARTAAGSSRTSAGEAPAGVSPGSARRNPVGEPPASASAARQAPSSGRTRPESIAAESSRTVQRKNGPVPLPAGKQNPLSESVARQGLFPAASSALAAAAPPLVHRVPAAAGENTAAAAGLPYAARLRATPAVSLPGQKPNWRAEEPGQEKNSPGKAATVPSGILSAGESVHRDRGSEPASVSGGKDARTSLFPAPPRQTPPFVRVPLIPTAVPLPEMLSHGVSAPDLAASNRTQGTARPEISRLWPVPARREADISRMPEHSVSLAAGSVPAAPAVVLSGTPAVLLPGQTGASAAGTVGKTLPQTMAAAASGHTVPAGSPAAMELRRTPAFAPMPAPSGGPAWESDGIRTVHRTRTTRRETGQESASTVSVQVPGESISRPVSQTFGPAEVERIADKVYRQIEERLRSEKMRRGM